MALTFSVSADWQFALYAGRSRPDATWTTSRLADLVKAFEWWVDTSKKQGAAHGVIAGDLFDNRERLDLPVLQAVAYCLKHAATNFKTLTLIPGNHDSYLRDSTVTALSLLRVTSSDRVNVVLDPTSVGFTDGRARWQVGFAPWTDDEAELREGVVNLGAVDVLFAHALVKGVAGSAGVDPATLKAGGARLIVLGDVHDPQEVEEAMWYVGAPLQLNFGDAGKPRGFMTITLNGAAGPDLDFHENTVSPQFRCLEAKAEEAEVVAGDFVRVDYAVETAADLPAVPDATVTVECAAPVAEAVVRMPELVKADSPRAVLETYVSETLPEGMDAEALIRKGLEYMELAK